MYIIFVIAPRFFFYCIVQLAVKVRGEYIHYEINYAFRSSRMQNNQYTCALYIHILNEIRTHEKRNIYTRACTHIRARHTPIKYTS